MNNALIKLTEICKANHNRFKYQESGVLAMEYAIMIAMLSIFIVAIFSQGGGFHNMLTQIWDTISNRMVTALS